MGVFVAGVPSSLAPRTPFFSRILAPLPLSRLRLLRRLGMELKTSQGSSVLNPINFSFTYKLKILLLNKSLSLRGKTSAI